MVKTVLVTGGAGFIGGNLVAFMRQKYPEWHVRVLDDFSTGLASNIRDVAVESLMGSILDSRLLNKAVQGVDSIVHLAAIGSVPRSIDNPMASHLANANGTLAVLEAARTNGVKHVIVASSSSVYGANPTNPRNEFHWTRPLSPYGVTKLATEAYANAYLFSYGMKTLALRFFNVYGPLQRHDSPYAAVIPRFLRAALDNLPVTIFGNGHQSRDFTYVETVCEAITEACKEGTFSEHPVNLAFGKSVSLLELVRAIEEVTRNSIHVEFSDPRPGDVQMSSADPEKMVSLFPELKPISLSDGLRRTEDWMRTEDPT